MIAPAEQYSIRVGTKYLGWDGKVYKISCIIIHPNFNVTDFDFALLKTVENIALDGVKTAAIKLPNAYESIMEGTAVFVSGWGLTRNDKETNTELRAVLLPIIKKTKCQEIYTDWFSPRTVCAGGPGMSSCLGDSGNRLGKILRYF